MPIFIIIQKDLAIRILSQPPRLHIREIGSHCFVTNSDFSITILRNFLASMCSYIRSGSWQTVHIEGFTLVY